jgi:hypothetical protein
MLLLLLLVGIITNEENASVQVDDNTNLMQR